MRVLHVHSGNLYGGVETILMTLARQRDCEGLQQEFALCFEGRLSRELAAVPARVHSIAAVRTSRPLSVLRARYEFQKLLVEEEFDTVVFHSAWSHAIFAPVARSLRKSAVIWMHGTTGGAHWTERWSRRTRPDLVVCNSRFTDSRAATVYPRTSRKVLYCPVELNSIPVSASERRKIREECSTAENSVVVIQVSRMESLKGHHLHLEALSKLKANPAWTCWFVGGPQRSGEEAYFDDIRQQATGLGIADRVRFLNERSDVPKLLRAADIFCQPNLQPESFGIVFIEALNAALPVVATNIGGANEIIDNTCGMLVAIDSAALAEALRKLIEEPLLRCRLAQGGPIRAEKLCNPAARIRELRELLSGVVSVSRLNS